MDIFENHVDGPARSTAPFIGRTPDPVTAAAIDEYLGTPAAAQSADAQKTSLPPMNNELQKMLDEMGVA